MTPHQLRLVRQSLEAAAPQRDRLAGLVFAELFARDPSLRLLFRGELRTHGQELYRGLAAIVASLDRLHAIAPALEWLAVRAAARGVAPRHYALFAEALSATIPAVGGADADELRDAWRAAAAEVGEVMAAALDAEPLAA